MKWLTDILATLLYLPYGSVTTMILLEKVFKAQIFVRAKILLFQLVYTIFVKSSS